MVSRGHTWVWTPQSHPANRNTQTASSNHTVPRRRRVLLNWAAEPPARNSCGWAAAGSSTAPRLSAKAEQDDQVASLAQESEIEGMDCQACAVRMIRASRPMMYQICPSNNGVPKEIMETRWSCPAGELDQMKTQPEKKCDQKRFTGIFHL